AGSRRPARRPVRLLRRGRQQRGRLPCRLRSLGGRLERKDHARAAAKSLPAPHTEPDFDCHDPRTAIKAMGAADLVVAMAAYRSFAADYANVLLPIVPFTETSGTYVNCEGRMQSFNGAVKPLGEARPAWKVLRVL